uniref:Adenylate kinase active site lid domain-containing protein n=1 Tax=Craspedostauros australis TaxID=1486917 RepID=A0A7R9ZMM0_9STRA|mmetsp:Transcript_1908/g.5252  ORF Transcript_1908/g.5252 Transcript_1908/m.5252 type:complete len:212 (+) Transcript_1908:1216-1851(+)
MLIALRTSTMTITLDPKQDFPQFQHLSSGDMLRKHVQNQTSLGKEAQAYMKAGKLVPDDLVFDLITEEADLESGRSILLDGFPRTVAQAEGLERLVHVDMVINLVIPTDTIVERISDRWIHAPSGRTYSYSYNPPKQHGLDDVTGEPLIQREDDKPECVRSRLETYEEATAPLVDYYSSNGVLESFHGTMSDVIYPNVKSWVEGRFDDGRE